MYKYRLAKPADLPEVVAIYNSTIASRQVTADLEPISIASREQWFAEHTPGYRPLWVVEVGGQIAGWLSFSSFYGRPAYRHTAEISVYIRESSRKSGLASFLLSAAIAHASELDIKVLLGFIFGHNTPSLNLFHKYDFAQWGQLPKVAELDGIERDLIIVGRCVAK